MRSPARHRRLVVLVGVVAATLASGLLLGDRLLAPAPVTPATDPLGRPVTTAEAARLAAVRVTDYRTGHAGVRVAIGEGATAVYLTGWIDWRTPLVYLDQVAPGGRLPDALLQAVPGVVATHPGRYTPPASAGPVDPFPAPPLPVPPTGWQVATTAADPAVQTVLSLLFTLRATRADDTARIATMGTRFMGTAEIGGVPVDVLDGAAVLPTRGAAEPAPGWVTRQATFASDGGLVRYWVDAGSRLLRAEALVEPDIPVRVDLEPADPTVPEAIEMLGGAPVRPTAPTSAELRQLAQLRVRDLAAGGGIVTVAVPAGSGLAYRGRGYLDWRHGVFYAQLRESGADAPDSLWRAGAAGVAAVAMPSGDAAGFGARAGSGRPSVVGGSGGMPEVVASPVPLPPLHPRPAGWSAATWAARARAGDEPDLDALVRTLLAQAAPTPDRPDRLAPVASRLRADTVDGVAVTVYEIRSPGVAPGQGRTRYWMDAAGRLRRLELRTGWGAWAYLTIEPGPVPALPDPGR